MTVKPQSMPVTRRSFLESTSKAVAAGAIFGGMNGLAGALPAKADTPLLRGEQRFDLLRHRFGVNYVPSRNWYFCYNDWDASAIARDFDRIFELGADHLRVMLIWPWFQPNLTYVSTAHLDRLDQLMQMAAERGFDVLPTIYTGWLSGFHFNPVFFEKEPFFTSPKWADAQDRFLVEVSKRMQLHPNFLGYDIGNEINCNWSCTPAEGDAWMKRIFQRMHTLCPNRVHVNGVDQNPWFESTTFSPEALVAQQAIAALHCWPFWTGAGKYGGHLDAPYTRLGAGMAALARSHGNDRQKPMWIEEFGACSEEMPEADLPKWLDLTMNSAIDEGVSWLTLWASHDVDRRFDFNPFEYGLGLITVDNRIKEHGRVFKRIANAYRGKPVKIPDKTLPPPPSERKTEITWAWLLDWMEVKKPASGGR